MAEWFRSWHGAPTDIKWRGVARRAGVAPGMVVAIAWALMDRASQADERGCIDGYDAEDLADFFGLEPDAVEAIIEAMIGKGVLARTQPNATEPSIRFASWDRRQPRREDGSAERAKAWREAKKSQASQEVSVERTEAERNRTQPNARTEKNREDNIEGESPSPPNGGDHKPTPKASVRGHLLPPDWMPTAGDIEHARRKGFSDQRTMAEVEKFKNHWAAASGANARKRDWSAAFNNWMTRAGEWSPPPKSPTGNAMPGEW